MIIIASDLDRATELIDYHVAEIVLSRKGRFWQHWEAYDTIKRPKLLQSNKEIENMFICFDPTDPQDVQAAMAMANSMGTGAPQTAASTASTAPAATPATKRKRRTKAEIEADKAAEAAAQQPPTQPGPTGFGAPALPVVTKDDVVAELNKAVQIHGADRIKSEVLRNTPLEQIPEKHYAAIIEAVKTLPVAAPQADDSPWG